MASDNTGPVTLSLRERQIAGASAAGKTRSRIAHRLCLAPATLRRHPDRIHRKPGVASRLALPGAIAPAGSEVPPRPDRPSIPVPAVEAMSDDPGHKHVSDGIADGITRSTLAPIRTSLRQSTNGEPVERGRRPDPTMPAGPLLHDLTPERAASAGALPDRAPARAPDSAVAMLVLSPIHRHRSLTCPAGGTDRAEAAARSCRAAVPRAGTGCPDRFPLADAGAQDPLRRAGIPDRPEEARP